MISVTDVVNLIIDKKVKELESLKQEKKDTLEILRKEEDVFFADFIKKLLSNNFKEYIRQRYNNGELIMDDERGYRDKFGAYEDDYLYLAMSFKRVGLVPKDYVNKTDAVYEEIDLLEKQIDSIKNSKDALIAEVTLQKLSSMDADFGKNIEALTDKIFNKRPIDANKQLN